MSAEGKSILSIVVAVIGAVLYIAASWYLLTRFALDKSIEESVWQRALIIFNGIASVGFACIGVLLGTSVQQVNLASAKAEVAKKTEAIKKAVEKLPAAPDDLGGGAETVRTNARIAEARNILMSGLS